MAPKVNCNAQKLMTVHTWMQKSRSVWSIKELEKQLASVASINTMQVKDYVQNLQDDNKINCEKIGAGNWYWSFPSQQKKTATLALEAAQKAHDKLSSTVQDLRTKLSERSAEMEKEEDMLENGSETREELIAKKAVLEAEVKDLQKELAGYSDNDPTELERKRFETKVAFQEAEMYTEDIDVLERYLRKQGCEGEQMEVLRMNNYGDEYDPEEQVMRELVLGE